MNKKIKLQYDKVINSLVTKEESESDADGDMELASDSGSIIYNSNAEDDEVKNLDDSGFVDEANNSIYISNPGDNEFIETPTTSTTLSNNPKKTYKKKNNNTR